MRSKANDVIIPCSGETAVDIATARCVSSDNVLLGGDLNIIRLKPHNGSFISYQLNGKRKYDIAKVAQGVSVVHLYGEHLKGIVTYNPQLDEQKKIVRIISSLDERIATQNKIIEDLKSLIKGSYKNTFSSLDGRKRKLGDICHIVKGQQVNGEFLTNMGQYYVMNGGTEPSGFYHKFNTPANTISISEGGNSCGYIQFNGAPFWSGGHCYTLQSLDIDVNYLYHFLKSKELDVMNLRIGSGLPNIQKKDLACFQVIVPKQSTQNKIRNGFNAIANKIKLERKLVCAYEMQKQYMLRSMFI